jgi:hypothetical protein
MHKTGGLFQCEYVPGAPLDVDAIEVSEPAILLSHARVESAKADVSGVMQRSHPSKLFRPRHASAGNTKTRMSEVEAALQCIPACCSREEWLTILFALQSEWSDDAFEMFEAWSKTCPDKFDEQDLNVSWDGADLDGGVTMGSFWRLAQEYDFDRDDYHRQIGDALRKRLQNGERS